MAMARGRHHEAWIAFSPLTRAENQRCALIVIGMAALLFGIVPRGVLYPPPGSSLDGTTRFRIQSDIGIEAVAFRVVSTVLSDDDVLDFTVYWRAVRPLEQNDQVSAVLIHLPTETRYGQADFHHPGGIPARRWTPGRLITDTVQLSIMDGMPTGQYTLTLEFSDCSNGCETQRRSFYDTDGIVQGETLTLPVVIEIVP